MVGRALALAICLTLGLASASTPSAAGSWATERTTRVSKVLPGLAWGAGVELRPRARLRVDIGVIGLLTMAPGKVALPTLSGSSMPGLHQASLAASLGWRL